MARRPTAPVAATTWVRPDLVTLVPDLVGDAAIEVEATAKAGLRRGAAAAMVVPRLEEAEAVPASPRVAPASGTGATASAAAGAPRRRLSRPRAAAASAGREGAACTAEAAASSQEAAARGGRGGDPAAERPGGGPAGEIGQCGAVEARAARRCGGQRKMTARRREGAQRRCGSGRALVAAGLECRAENVQLRMGFSRRKPSPVLAGGDGDDVLGRRSPRWGRHLGAHPCCTGSLGESPVQSGRAAAAPFCVVTFLEASFFRGPSQPVALSVSLLVKGCRCGVARRLGADGRKEGGY
ncbi:unnamed protein product [Urochloa humidicola]